MTSRLKGQGTTALASIMISLIAAFVSFASSYLTPIVVIAACTVTGFAIMKKKGSLGQAEILISLVIIMLTAGSVVAYGAYNGTLNSSFTGALTGADINGINDRILISENHSLVSSATIDVWAESTIDITYDEDRLVLRLNLDDGSPIPEEILQIYINGEHVLNEITDMDGEIIIGLPLENGTYTIEARFDGIPEEYVNPSYDATEVEVGEVTVIFNETSEWISYNPETDTITITGDGLHCTSYNPCTFTDVYEQDRANGWGKVENFNSYFTVHSAIKVGNGINKTFVVSERQQFMIEKPLEIMPLGSFDFLTSWIQANVSEEYLMERKSALYVHPGGYLGFLTSSYKVFHPFSSNNILALDGSRIRIERFTMQCIKDSCRTTFFMPSDTEMTDFNFAKNSDYVCVTPGSCLSDLMVAVNDKPLYSYGGASR